MIYRGPGFLAVDYSNLLLGSPPTPPPPPTVSKIDRRRLLLTGEGKGVGEEPNHTTSIRPQERQDLYKSFNTLYMYVYPFRSIVFSNHNSDLSARSPPLN
jgi:hypothetical protein